MAATSDRSSAKTAANKRRKNQPVNPPTSLPHKPPLAFTGCSDRWALSCLSRPRASSLTWLCCRSTVATPVVGESSAGERFQTHRRSERRRKNPPGVPQRVALQWAPPAEGGGGAVCSWRGHGDLGGHALDGGVGNALQKLSIVTP